MSGSLPLNWELGVNPANGRGVISTPADVSIGGNLQATGDFTIIGPVVSVAPSGVDDTVALQTAFNSGYPVRLNGTYYASSPLTVPVGGIILADDVNAYDTSAPNSQIIAKGSKFPAGSAVLTLSGYNFLRGFSVSSVTGTDAIASSGRFVSLERIYTTGGRYGCNLNGIGPQLRYCRFSTASSHGLYCQSSVTDGVFIGNFCNGNGGNGAQFLDSIKCSLIGNTFEWNTLIGLEIYQARNCVVSGNSFDRNSQAGLRLNICQSVSIVGNEFSRNGVAAGSYDCHVSLAGASSAISFAGNNYIAVAENDDGSGTIVPDYTYQIEASSTLTNSVFAEPQVAGNVAVFVNAASQDILDPLFIKIKQGSKTNDNALAGEIGEFLSANGSFVPMTNGVLETVATLTLTPGDWDVEAGVGFTPGATTVTSYAGAAINTSNTAYPAIGSPGMSIHPNSFTSNQDISLSPGRVRFSIAIDTTIYLIAQANFTTSTMNVSGTLTARRAR